MNYIKLFHSTVFKDSIHPEGSFVLGMTRYTDGEKKGEIHEHGRRVVSFEVMDIDIIQGVKRVTHVLEVMAEIEDGTFEMAKYVARGFTFDIVSDLIKRMFHAKSKRAILSSSGPYVNGSIKWYVPVFDII